MYVLCVKDKNEVFRRQQREGIKEAFSRGGSQEYWAPEEFRSIRECCLPEEAFRSLVR